MKNIKLLLLSILSLLVFFTSCDKDDDPTMMANEEVNDCVEYSPSEASNVINGRWLEANEVDDYVGAIVIPADAGGGYVKVLLSQSDPDLKPALFVDNDLDAGGTIIGGSSVQTNDTQSRVAHFAVHPGQSYSIRAYPFFNALAYPVDYTLSWEFFSRVDCFEPNDVKAEAKKILLDETIEAYAIAGHIDYSVGSLDENTYDWYKVRLDSPTQLVAEITDMPNDMRIALRLFTEDNIVSYDFEWLGAETDSNRGRLSKITSTSVLDSGTYYIEMHSDFVLSRIQNSDLETIPEHFDKKYKLKLLAL